MITLKLATSLDGRIATAAGESRWITGQAARDQSHWLRGNHHAVVIGVETAIADDPDLTVRLPAYDGAQPARVILDSRQRLPLNSRLARTANEIPSFVVSTQPPKPALTKMGVKVLTVASEGRRPTPSAILNALSQHLGPRLIGESFRVMIEGGGQVAASFLAAGLVDRIEWFRASSILGGEGRPAIADGLDLARLADAPRFKRVEVSSVGDDLWERYEKL